MSGAPHIRQILLDPTADLADKAQRVAAFQLRAVPAFRSFAEGIHRLPGESPAWQDYPFLPVGMFQREKIIADGFQPVVHFESSGTTGSATSRHYLADEEIYRESILSGFERAYGPPADHVFFALLPSYLERKHASLVYMVRELMEASGDRAGGFYRYDYEGLLRAIKAYNGTRKIALIGVTYALWEMAERHGPVDLSYATIFETGGMKGRRREIVREELHEILKNAFGVPAIHSEYGMTEMLSQAWSDGDGIFRCPPWMKVLVRDPYDPLAIDCSGKGVLNVIDLANLYSCSFLATNDLGEVFEDGRFTISGRMDNSQLRGCNLMF